MWLVICEVCGAPIMSNGECLHTAMGFTAEEWLAAHPGVRERMGRDERRLHLVRETLGFLQEIASALVVMLAGLLIVCWLAFGMETIGRAWAWVVDAAARAVGL